MRSSEWVTRMARLAATELRRRLGHQRGSGRVLVAARRDAQGVLALVPERYGVVRGCWRHFLLVPRPPVLCRADALACACRRFQATNERSTTRTRRSPTAPIPRSWSSRQPQRVRVDSSRCGADIPWRCCTSRFAPSRSSPQGRGRMGSQPGRADRRAPGSARRRAADEPLPGAATTSTPCDEELETGLADGTLAVDARLATPCTRCATTTERSCCRMATPLAFPLPDVADAAAFAAEASVLLGIDAITAPRAASRALEEAPRSPAYTPRR